jgi:hypothetical protein
VTRPRAPPTFRDDLSALEELRRRHPARFNIPKNTNPSKFLFPRSTQMNTRKAEMITNRHVTHRPIAVRCVKADE